MGDREVCAGEASRGSYMSRELWREELDTGLDFDNLRIPMLGEAITVTAINQRVFSGFLRYLEFNRCLTIFP